MAQCQNQSVTIVLLYNVKQPVLSSISKSALLGTNRHPDRLPQWSQPKNLPEADLGLYLGFVVFGAWDAGSPYDRPNIVKL